MYKVNAETFDSFMKAVASANKIGAEVFDDKGVRRWAPAKLPSAKKVRMYNERMAAYNAQQLAKAA